MRQVIDMHCDTLMQAHIQQLDDIYEMPGMVDLKRMKEGISLAQFFAVFIIPPEEVFDWHPELIDRGYDIDEYIESNFNIFHNSIKLHTDIIKEATCSKDIEDNDRAGLMSAILTMEDGRAVNGDMNKIKQYYDAGVRALSLTWNYKNCFGSPNSTDDKIMQEGLTDFGKEAIQYMQEIGMLVDVSHLSDGGFRDVAEICRKPFIASHSNARALSPHPRNLTDDMIRTLGEKGGVMGINFMPDFLNEDIHNHHSTIERMVKMAQHEANVGGIEVVGIGTDFDGIEGELDLDRVENLDRLAIGLGKGGFTDDQIDLIFRKNSLRVMNDAMH